MAKIKLMDLARTGPIIKGFSHLIHTHTYSLLLTDSQEQLFSELAIPATSSPMCGSLTNCNIGHLSHFFLS